MRGVSVARSRGSRRPRVDYAGWALVRMVLIYTVLFAIGAYLLVNWLG